MANYDFYILGDSYLLARLSEKEFRRIENVLVSQITEL
jgi:hypothetical protein